MHSDVYKVFFGAVCFGVDNFDGFFGCNRGCDFGPVSYTHLTLPTNREV